MGIRQFFLHRREDPHSSTVPKPSPDLSFTNIEINGIDLRITDFASRELIRDIKLELERDVYNIDRIPFAPRDIVLDIGANVGIVSLYLAKKFPKITILAYEPIPENFSDMLANLALNGVGNVTVYELALTHDGRDLEMIVHMANTGGASAQMADMKAPGNAYHRVKSTTLDQVFEEHGIERCRLLKIDCEGSEHEILMNSESLSRVEYLSAEFHINAHLERQGYSIERLADHCRKFVDPLKLKYETMRMAE